MKHHATGFVCLLIAAILLLCSCETQTEEKSQSEISDTSAAQSTSDVASQNSIPSEDASEPAPAAQEETARDLFIAKYGYNIDSYSWLSEDDTFYEALLNNPIEAWQTEQSVTDSTTAEMCFTQDWASENWKREIERAIGWLSETLPELQEKLTEGQKAWETSLNAELALDQDVLSQLEAYGTLYQVLCANEFCNACRDRAFHLMYLEYLCADVLGLDDTGLYDITFEQPEETA